MFKHLEPIVERVISSESAVNIEPVLDTPVIETIDEETVKTEEISTALPTEEPTESIIEQDMPLKIFLWLKRRLNLKLLTMLKTNYVQISIPKRKKNQVKVAFSAV